ncbi:glycosyltransferase [Rhodobacter ferrooxidans]|uniref:Glycosyl transferase family 2 n=1 Tax=Rhodobacter ferrooxidans TaxID=371731 RepID=C8S4A5_9RHOB|nr:glycosyltransferase [Rhodobacter sp. SW2]EEW24164.1 glycosyl transferase family 2 [Rhodobacter sp. SW2]
MTPAPDVSVILPLFDDAASIGAVLAGLRAQVTARRVEIIVVDDGSRDAGPQIARDMGARVITQSNAGPAAARNRGAQAAGGAVVLFLDSDCVPPPNWVEAMASVFDTKGFDAVMGTICAANDGVVPRIVQAEVDERYAGMRIASTGVDFIAAPACGFRRQVFLALGGFDVRLRQAEDVEIAYRITTAGHRIGFVDTAAVAHHHQTGWAEFLRVKLRRARGRMEVFRLYPAKRRHDNWTPLRLKLQFGCAAISLPMLLVALALAPRTGGLALGLPLLCLGGLLWAGVPSIRAIAHRIAPRSGWGVGLLVGAAYVLARAYVILLAVVQTKVFPRPLHHQPPQPLCEDAR